MGKNTRRGLTAAAAGLAAMAIAAPALAADVPSMRDDNDHMTWQWDNYSNTKRLFRVAGPDRIDTAIKLNKSSSKVWSNNCILARDDDFPDALAAAPLADVLDAPIYLTAPGDTVDARTVAAMKAQFTSLNPRLNGCKNVYVLGGTGVITENATSKLWADGFAVTRLRGVDRYETAKNIAIETANKVMNEGANPRTINVYLATGKNFPDALAAGAAAADNDGVVLLTEDTKMNTEFTYKFLKRQYDTLMPGINGIEIHTVGGQAEAAARSSIEDIRDTNTGTDRYQTATKLFGKYHHSINKVAITSGETFADAITAGAWVANHDGALLLTENASLNGYTKTALTNYYAGSTDIVVVGGTGAVSPAVSAQLGALMTW